MSDEQEKAALAEFEAMAFRMPTRRRLEVGQMTEGKVLAIGDSDVFVDLGTKSEGTIDRQEVTDKDGNVTVEVGDTVTTYVVSLEPEIVLSYAIGRAHLNMQALQDAHDLGIPVEGKVTGQNKGGLEVDLGGTRAFCPVSQIQLGFCEDPSIYLGQTLKFRISRYEEDGRNIVVSRRALLQEEQEEAAEETRASLQEGAEFMGEVQSLQPYGAFVDIGGVQGMVHISEISHRRIEHPSEALSVGQQVRVRVTKIERDPKHPERERIGLSIRALLGDPWEESTDVLGEGATVSGTVVRLQPFGAFIELAPGVDGLAHISELSDRRIKHPSEVLTIGQSVEVKVLKVDRDSKRISLSLRDAQAGGDAAESPEIAVGSLVDVVVNQVKPFGLFVNIKGAGRGGRGLVPTEETGAGRQTNLRRAYPEGTELKAMITNIDEEGKIRLSLIAADDQDERASYSQYVDKGGDKAGAAQPSMGTLADKLMQALNKKG